MRSLKLAQKWQQVVGQFLFGVRRLPVITIVIGNAFAVGQVVRLRRSVCSLFLVFSTISRVPCQLIGVKLIFHDFTETSPMLIHGICIIGASRILRRSIILKLTFGQRWSLKRWQLRVFIVRITKILLATHWVAMDLFH